MNQFGDMAESETGLSDLMEEFDLDVNDTGYERDVDVEIIDGFYYQNMAFMNDRVRLFADYWMKLYSNCCLQRDYAVELLHDNKPEEAKAILQDWPDTLGLPRLPQLLLETPDEPKRKKRSAALIECDAVTLINEMEDNYIRGDRIITDVLNVFPKGEVSLVEYENHIICCDKLLKLLKTMLFKMHSCMICGSVERSRSFERRRV